MTDPLKPAVPGLSGTTDQFRGREVFPRLGQGWERGWFREDLSSLHVLCTIFLVSAPPLIIKH